MQTNARSTFDDVEKIAEDLKSRVKCRPTVGIVCGSGLGKLADLVEDKEIILYTEIPGFPTSSVHGHSGELVFGTLGGKQVILMKGRAHCYEGHSPQKTALPIRVMKLMGVTTLIVTNAAGGINNKFNAGDMMIIKDHINMPGFAGLNPLMGPNDERFGPRFPAMSTAYDSKLRQLARSQAEALGFSDFLQEGVYTMATGPAYETPAECKYLGMIGTDAIGLHATRGLTISAGFGGFAIGHAIAAVSLYQLLPGYWIGMSTVPEVMVAAHCGIRVLGISLITNKVIQDYDNEAAANHEEVLETAQRRSVAMQSLVKSVIENM